MPATQTAVTRSQDSTGDGMENSIAVAPVIFFIFNRPETTAKVLERIRAARPATILVVADGPRANRVGEAELCRRTRELVLAGIDWQPLVLTDFSSENLGCRKRISSGLIWAFEHVTEAIVLEDDCVPDPSFFRFTTELLARYRDDTRVGVISGDNFQPQPMSLSASYYFSKYNHCWGWATWRRAWKFYDDAMGAWPELRESGWLEGIFPRLEYSIYWREKFDGVWQRKIDTWDFVWTFCCWSQHLLAILPRTNLVTNIGIGADATHTDRADPNQHFLKSVPMVFPLTHPQHVVMNHQADADSQARIFGEAKLKNLPARLRRLGRKLRRVPARVVSSRKSPAHTHE